MNLVITGANGNLGSYLTKKYIETANNLILLYNKKSDRIKEFIIADRDNIKTYSVDLKDFNALSKIFHSLNITPDHLIHTASQRSTDFSKLADSAPTKWKKIIDNNILPTYNILKILIPRFRKTNKKNRIVLLGSNVSKIGLKQGSAYSASKAAIANISRSVVQEEAKNNIIINTVSPGPIEIDDSHFSPDYRNFRKRYYKKQLEHIPMKCFAQLEDVFNLCDFLISEKNNYVNGEEIFMTGGRH